MGEVRTPIVRIKFGSRLYGTATETSDTDYKSVHLPSAEDILLQRVSPVVKTDGRAKVEGERNLPTDVDDESYALHRYLQLLAEGQTVALDMLFAPVPEFTSPTWQRIQANAGRLISKRSAAFVGYCRTQANKYGIKGSRVAAARAAMEFFGARVADYGPLLKLNGISIHILEALCSDEHTKIVQGEARPMDSAGVIRCETFFECCNRKVSFNGTVKQAYEMYKRVYEEYGARARAAEVGDGIDWKALSHAVRVGWEAVELLTIGKITFPIPNAKFLVEVKTGQVPYATVVALIEWTLTAVELAAQESKLPDVPDLALMDEIVAEAYLHVVKEA